MAQEELAKKRSRAEQIVQAGISSSVTDQARAELEKIEFHEGYAEPGYDGDLIATGNWNSVTRWVEDERRSETLDDTPDRVGTLLEKIGVEIEWSDEWSTCDECQNLVRTSPDSYGWTPSYVSLGEFDKVCEDCTDGEDYLMSIEGNAGTLNQTRFQPEDHGYTKIDDYEHGFHPGQDADPRLIAKEMEAWGIERFIFHLESKGQFDMRFALYVHNDELEEGIVWNQYPSTPPKVGEEAIEALIEHLTRGRTDGPSVSAAMKRGLQEASRQMKGLKGDGIKVIKVTPDGVTSKLVSPKDFVEGKALDGD